MAHRTKVGSGDAELVAVYSPVFQKPLIIDWKSLGKSPDASTLIRVAGDSVTGKVAASGLYADFGSDGLCMHGTLTGNRVAGDSVTGKVAASGLFSFQTLIDQDTRRRRTTYEHMRDDMMVHIFRAWFSERLAAC